jgi:hypothetical protein
MDSLFLHDREQIPDSLANHGLLRWELLKHQW